MPSKNGDAMGIFYVECRLSNLRRAKRVTVPKLLVDSGSELTWIPHARLKQLGVRVEKKDVPFLMANGQTVTRATGYAILRVEGFETVDEVVFGQEDDLTLLGARTLEGFGALVDSRHKKLVAAGAFPAAERKPEGA